MDMLDDSMDKIKEEDTTANTTVEESTYDMDTTVSTTLAKPYQYQHHSPNTTFSTTMPNTTTEWGVKRDLTTLYKELPTKHNTRKKEYDLYTGEPHFATKCKRGKAARSYTKFKPDSSLSRIKTQVNFSPNLISPLSS
jgi:hypothetical protein